MSCPIDSAVASHLLDRLLEHCGRVLEADLVELRQDVRISEMLFSLDFDRGWVLNF